MIINEKQIMQLIEIAHRHIGLMLSSGAPHESIKNISSLLNEIELQQSSELKEVK